MLKKVYRSRFSVLLLVLILVILSPLSILLFTHKIYQDMYILGSVFVFAILIYRGIHYIIIEDKLYIKIWFIPTCSLNINDIASLTRSYYLFDIPTNTTASFKKLCIQFSIKTPHSYIHVSPAKEKEFIEELLIVNPNIYVSLYDKKGIGRIFDWDI